MGIIMENKLAYYRSLDMNDVIALPLDLFQEYLDLLVRESNKNFHDCLADMSVSF